VGNESAKREDLQKLIKVKRRKETAKRKESRNAHFLLNFTQQLIMAQLTIAQFYNTYTHREPLEKVTAKACKFADMENMQSLQKSLKGLAREAGKSIQVSPNNLNQVIKILQRR
jgi:hypothetical protein